MGSFMTRSVYSVPCYFVTHSSYQNATSFLFVLIRALSFPQVISSCMSGVVLRLLSEA